MACTFDVQIRHLSSLIVVQEVHGTTICFLEPAYPDIFRTSQQDINTNMLKSAEMAVRCMRENKFIFREHV